MQRERNYNLTLCISRKVKKSESKSQLPAPDYHEAKVVYIP